MMNHGKNSSNLKYMSKNNRIGATFSRFACELAVFGFTSTLIIFGGHSEGGAVAH